VDVLIKVLVMQILPAIFEQRAMEKAEKERLYRRICALPGGSAVLEKYDTPRPVYIPHCFYTPNPTRDEAASKILEHKQISAPIFDGSKGFHLECYSSLALENVPGPKYAIWLGLNGMLHCTCEDLQRKGGACKHIRAGLLSLHNLRLSGISIPDIPVPTSELDARTRQFTLAACFASCQVPSDTISADTTDDRPIVNTARLIDDLLVATDTFYLDDDTSLLSTKLSPANFDTDSDTESIATDAGDEFDFTLPPNASKNAYDEQAISRVFVELEQAAPKLGELAHFLNGVALNVDDVSRAVEFRDQLTLLARGLTHLIDDAAAARTANSSSVAVPAPAPTSPPPSSSLTPPTTSHTSSTSASLHIMGPSLHLKRPSSRELLPPSPEKKQKRKVSWKAW
jgi:hypothetical protein